MIRYVSSGLLLATMIILVGGGSAQAERKSYLSRQDQQEIAQQVKDLQDEIDGVGGEIARGPGNCLTRKKGACADGDSCDTGRACQPNTGTFGITACACYDLPTPTPTPVPKHDVGDFAID